jgi:hypothetical protein
MEMTEKERLRLVKKKETVREATLRILEMSHDLKNCLEIKKNFQFILEGLSTIASYSNSKNYDLDKLTESVDALFQLMTSETRKGMWILSPIVIEHICNVTNSARFDFTKKGFKIALPKIKNLNVGSITNK